MLTPLVLLLSLINAPDARDIGTANCALGEVTINSRVLQGQIILLEKRRSRPAVNAELEFFILRNGRWQRYSLLKAVNSEARFALLEVDPGRYLVNAKIDGYRATSVYINIRMGVAKTEVVIPLSNGRCGNARLRNSM
jgi:hypothetical protein